MPRRRASVLLGLLRRPVFLGRRFTKPSSHLLNHAEEVLARGDRDLDIAVLGGDHLGRLVLLLIGHWERVSPCPALGARLESRSTCPPGHRGEDRAGESAPRHAPQRNARMGAEQAMGSCPRGARPGSQALLPAWIPPPHPD